MTLVCVASKSHKVSECHDNLEVNLEMVTHKKIALIRDLPGQITSRTSCDRAEAFG
jgi:hypothetical protein